MSALPFKADMVRTSALRRALNDVSGDPPREWPLYLNLPLSFVPNLAFDLLDQLWRGFDAVCFSRVLCRLLQQFALTFSAGLVVAARHEVTAAKYFCHDDFLLMLGDFGFQKFVAMRIESRNRVRSSSVPVIRRSPATSPARMAASRRSTRPRTIKIALIELLRPKCMGAAGHLSIGAVCEPSSRVTACGGR
jgi:hypothetical protein